MSQREVFDPPNTAAVFKFAEAFPPTDSVGHFVIGLAAAMNDLNLLNGLLFPSDNPDRSDFSEAERATLTRLLLGVVWESHLLVTRADKDPAVRTFLDRVADMYPPKQAFTGTELVSVLRGEGGAAAPGSRNVLRLARNSAFHYQPDNAAHMVEVLQTLADDDETGGLVFGERMPSYRAEFADLVQLRLALRTMPDPFEDSVRDLVERLASTVIAVVHLAQTAIDLWLHERGAASVVTVAEFRSMSSDVATGDGPP